MKVEKILIPCALVSQALTLAAFMVKGSVSAVCMFAAACAVEAFLVWINRKNIEEIDQLKADMTKIKSALDAVLVEANLRMGRSL